MSKPEIYNDRGIAEASIVLMRMVALFAGNNVTPDDFDRGAACEGLPNMQREMLRAAGAFCRATEEIAMRYMKVQ